VPAAALQGELSRLFDQMTVRRHLRSVKKE
jgi:hypothetical protein